MTIAAKLANQQNLYGILKKPFESFSVSAIEQWAASYWQYKPLEGKVAASMLFPPPNVTGSLHLGHALTACIQDAHVRANNMRGRRIWWIPGFDHAGLGTQRIVDNLLWERDRVKRKDISREKYLQTIEEWKIKKRSEMIIQLKRLGLSLSYGDEFFTLDEERSLAVRESFRVLFNKGVIVRGIRQVFWSDELGTTLSDIEVDQQERNGCIVNCCSRTGEIVKTKDMNHWFLKPGVAATKSVEYINNSDINLMPSGHKNSWSNWLIDNGVKDWCLSRQSCWGHQIPAYKFANMPDINENWVVADSLEEATCLLQDKFPSATGFVEQDKDVLDTWYSSAILPLSVLGWPNKEKFNNAKETGLFPMELLETGYDILNFWVSKMVMMSYLLSNSIPFKNVILHGMICDSFGKKMSKSKGNVIDPLDIMDGMSFDKMTEEHKQMFPRSLPERGADGLRTFLLSNDFQEQNVDILYDKLDLFGKLPRKLWTIYKNIFSYLDSFNDVLIYNFNEANLKVMNETDANLVNKLVRCINAINIDEINYHQGLRLIEMLCSQELNKKYLRAISSGSLEERRFRFLLLIEATLEITRLLHPIMPHTTEYLYQKFQTRVTDCGFDKLISLSNTKYPTSDRWLQLLSTNASNN